MITSSEWQEPSHRNELVLLPVSAFQLNLLKKEPDGCQPNGGYQKVNVLLLSVPFLNKNCDQALRIRP
jgi:hypothetical protein